MVFKEELQFLLVEPGNELVSGVVERVQHFHWNQLCKPFCQVTFISRNIVTLVHDLLQVVSDVIQAGIDELRHDQEVGRDEYLVNVLVRDFLNSTFLSNVFHEPLEQRNLTLNADVQILNTSSVGAALFSLAVVQVEKLHFSEQKPLLALEGFLLLVHGVNHVDLNYVLRISDS